MPRLYSFTVLQPTENHSSVMKCTLKDAGKTKSIIYLTHQPNVEYMSDMAYMSHVSTGEEVKGKTARVQVIQEVWHDSESDWRLCFQWCRYIYGDGTMEEGYRFIWRRPDGSLQAARGQARLPSIEIARALMDKAVDEGWGKNKG